MVRAAPLPHRPHHPAEGRPPNRVKGRGAASNQSGRYEREQREAVDDGWQTEDPIGPPQKTNVTLETPRKIITYNTSPDIGFDRSINPYRGCEHGCIYCFARPSHAYMGLSPGLDFERELLAKPNAAQVLEKELASPSYAPRPIAMGTNTDPYQPIERNFRLMRSILSVLDRFSHPVTILTKSASVLRDLDLISSLAKRHLARVMLSITTLDPVLARAMEPRASAPHRRLAAVKELTDAGIETGVMTAPMIPALNDHELENLLAAAAEHGAQFAGYTIIRLPLEVSPLFQEWLAGVYPDRAKRIMGHIREHNGGRDYDAQRSRGGEVKSAYAKLIGQRFAAAARRHNLARRPQPLDLSQFKRPPATTGQLDLFS